MRRVGVLPCQCCCGVAAERAESDRIVETSGVHYTTKKKRRVRSFYNNDDMEGGGRSVSEVTACGFTAVTKGITRTEIILAENPATRATPRVPRDTPPLTS